MRPPVQDSRLQRAHAAGTLNALCAQCAWEQKRELTFCWRHSLQARLTAVLRRADDGRVSSPFSFSSSLDAERLKPRVLVGDVGEMA